MRKPKVEKKIPGIPENMTTRQFAVSMKAIFEEIVTDNREEMKEVIRKAILKNSKNLPILLKLFANYIDGMPVQEIRGNVTQPVTIVFASQEEDDGADVPAHAHGG